MRVRLPDIFLQLPDHADVEDGYGLGWTFRVLRANHPTAKTRRGGARTEVALLAQIKPVLDRVQELGIAEPTLEQLGEVYTELLLAGKVEAIDNSKAEERLQQAAAAVVDGWQGVLDDDTGEPVPFGPEALAAVLGHQAITPDGEVLGPALCRHLLAESQRLGANYAQELRRAEGNSGRSSAGEAGSPTGTKGPRGGASRASSRRKPKLAPKRRTRS